MRCPHKKDSLSQSAPLYRRVENFPPQSASQDGAMTLKFIEYTRPGVVLDGRAQMMDRCFFSSLNVVLCKTQVLYSGPS